MNEYREQLKKGVINKAYKGLMEYIMALKTHLKNKYPDFNHLDTLTKQIEKGTIQFIRDIERFLLEH